MPRADGVNYTGGNEMWGYGTCGEVPFRSSRVPTITFVLVPVCELGDESPLPWLIFVWGNLGRRRVGDTTRSKAECWRYYTVEGGVLEIVSSVRDSFGHRSHIYMSPHCNWTTTISPKWNYYFCVSDGV